jgi:hypothetical protein
MPLFFVGYAFAVWALAARWRRRIPGFLAVLIGTAGLMALNWLHYKLSDWTEGEIYLPVLQSIMYPYTGLVAVVGVFVACIPRIHAWQCRQCGYDLRGLSPDGKHMPGRGAVCPECGTPVAPARPVSTRPSGMDRETMRTPDIPSAPVPAPDHHGRRA